jgi:hippurate hydrolase
MSVVQKIAGLSDEMTRWRRDIHAHPELGFEETRTSELVAKKLAEFGIQVHRGIGKTGVVGVLRSGSSKRTLGLRADMDCLPIQEANTFAHRSTQAGKMHACGHDGHTTMLLGAARYLAETKNFDGTVNFIFQPAEEGIGGAKAMVDDGLFKRFPCDAIFGMHNRPGMALGKFAVRSGAMMAGGAFFDIDIEGPRLAWRAPGSRRRLDPGRLAHHRSPAKHRRAQRPARRHGSPVGHSDPRWQRVQRHPANRAAVGNRACVLERGDEFDRPQHRARRGRRRRRFRRESEDRFPPDIPPAHQQRRGSRIRCEHLFRDRRRREREARPALIMASEDFSFMLNEVRGCYINIGNGDGEGACEVHNPGTTSTTRRRLTERASSRGWWRSGWRSKGLHPGRPLPGANPCGHLFVDRAPVSDCQNPYGSCSAIYPVDDTESPHLVLAISTQLALKRLST